MLLEDHLSNLLTVVLQEGNGSFTGNLFYENLDQAKNLTPIDSLRWKRENLAILAKEASCGLEIGFAAGHSALLMLLSNRDLRLTIVDACEYKHTEHCFKYLDHQFPERLTLIKGRSPGALSALESGSFDLVHLDGGKHFTIKEDLDAIKNLVAARHALCIDDTQNPGINHEVVRRIRTGELTIEKYRDMNTRSKQSQWTHCVCNYLCPEASQ